MPVVFNWNSDLSVRQIALIFSNTNRCTFHGLKSVKLSLHRLPLSLGINGVGNGRAENQEGKKIQYSVPIRIESTRTRGILGFCDHARGLLYCRNRTVRILSPSTLVVSRVHARIVDRRDLARLAWFQSV